MADTTETPDTDTDDGQTGAKCPECGVPEKTALAFERQRKDIADRDERIETLSERALHNGLTAAGFSLVETGDDGSKRENKHLSLVVREWLNEHPNVEEFDADSFSTFAAEYGVTPTRTSGSDGDDNSGGGGSGAGSEAADSQARQLAAMKADADQIRDASRQTEPSGDLDSELAELAEKGEWDQVGRLQTRRLVRDATGGQ